MPDIWILYHKNRNSRILALVESRRSGDYHPYLVRGEEAIDVGAVVMLGSLLGLIVVIFGVVMYFDPEARRTPADGRDE